MVGSNEGSNGQKLFRVKLDSGRLLGPIDLYRIALLISKNQIQGSEQCKALPDGEWKPIAQHPEIAALLLDQVQGKLDLSEIGQRLLQVRPLDKTQLLPGSFPTENSEEKSTSERTMILPSTLELEEASKEKSRETTSAPEPFVDDEATVVDPHALSEEGESLAEPGSSDPISDPDEQTKTELQKAFVFKKGAVGPNVLELERGVFPRGRNVSSEQTVLFDFNSPFSSPSHSPHQPYSHKKTQRKIGLKQKITIGVLTSCLVYVAYDIVFPEPPQSLIPKVLKIRPQLPVQNVAQPDPGKSQKIFNEGVRYYLLDTVDGYRLAAEKFLVAASVDGSNVRAVALLASSYLNLIDSSNKDENYFSVILKLIELSRAKNVDLPETVIADAEFYVTANKAEAAENRIVEFTKLQRSFGDMYYYLAWVLYQRGDYRTSARYLSQFPDNKVGTPRVFYLRGQLAEKLSSTEDAVHEYGNAIKLSPTHAKSRIRIAALLEQNGRVIEGAGHLQYVISHPSLLSSKDLAYAYFLFSRLKQVLQNYPQAKEAIQKAIALDHNNSDFLLEFYSLKAKTGTDVSEVRGKARMYYFMSEGEKFLQQGQNQEAMNRFLQARESDFSSPIPPLRIGDMFARQRDEISALLNYKKAAELAPNDIDIWSKYIEALIQNYEWKEAEKAMDRFRGRADANSAIDKLAGDMYAKQGMYVEAMSFYRKAMGRESIDPAVYMSYGRALMATRNYQHAPLFFALAQRLDPLNVDALIGSAQAVAQAESIDRGISILQDEIQRTGTSRAELFAAIGSLQIQKGDFLSAQQSINQAIESNADFPDSYRYRAMIELNRIQTAGLKGKELDQALDRALAAFKAYSDRNPSDPAGYLERFRIYAEQKQYEKASEELNRVYTTFPKYPGLHYLKGNLYLVQGQHELAVAEYQTELKNHPHHVDTLVAYAKELIQQKDPDQAMVQLNKAMMLAPQLAEPKHWAGYAAYLSKNYQGAIALYQAAIQLDAGNPMIYKRLGLAYKTLGDLPAASKAFQRYIELAPDAPDRAEFSPL